MGGVLVLLCCMCCIDLMSYPSFFLEDVSLSSTTQYHSSSCGVSPAGAQLLLQIFEYELWQQQQ